MSDTITRLSLIAGSRFAKALAICPLPEDVLSRLSEPSEVFRFQLPLRRDDSSLRMLTGWRVRYSNLFGPTKGGVRFDPNTNEADLTALAFRLLLKCAVNGLPHGGAGGGIAADHRGLSSAERERLARSYVEALGDRLGPDRDILSPDLGTEAVTMGWMADEYNRLHRTCIAGAINGKPLALGGIPGRPGATARGAWMVLREVLQWKGIDPRGLTCALQGYGSAGGHLAVLLEEQGVRVVSASDLSGGWHAPSGLDAKALWKIKQEGRSFSEVEIDGARRVGAREVLTVPVDIVIPAATASQITTQVAAELDCRIVLEIANGPIASDAEPLVEAKNILVIPDVVANAGGITMSHFEWAQNLGGALWSAEEAHTRLDARMLATARAAIRKAQESGVSLAVAAQILALEKISAILAR